MKILLSSAQWGVSKRMWVGEGQSADALVQSIRRDVLGDCADLLLVEYHDSTFDEFVLLDGSNATSWEGFLDERRKHLRLSFAPMGSFSRAKALIGTGNATGGRDKHTVIKANMPLSAQVYGVFVPQQVEHDRQQTETTAPTESSTEVTAVGAGHGDGSGGGGGNGSESGSGHDRRWLAEVPGDAPRVAIASAKRKLEKGELTQWEYENIVAVSREIGRQASIDKPRVSVIHGITNASASASASAETDSGTSHGDGAGAGRSVAADGTRNTWGGQLKSSLSKFSRQVGKLRGSSKKAAGASTAELGTQASDKKQEEGSGRGSGSGSGRGEGSRGAGGAGAGAGGANSLNSHWQWRASQRLAQAGLVRAASTSSLLPGGGGGGGGGRRSRGGSSFSLKTATSMECVVAGCSQLHRYADGRCHLHRHVPPPPPLCREVNEPAKDNSGRAELSSSTGPRVSDHTDGAGGNSLGATDDVVDEVVAGSQLEQAVRLERARSASRSRAASAASSIYNAGGSRHGTPTSSPMRSSRRSSNPAMAPTLGLKVRSVCESPIPEGDESRDESRDSPTGSGADVGNVADDMGAEEEEKQAAQAERVVAAATPLRPARKHAHGGRRHSLQRRIKATLTHGRRVTQMREIVMVPAGEKQEEWFLVNLYDFFNDVSLLFGMVSELCTEHSCPKMTAGKAYEYLWADVHLPGLQDIEPGTGEPPQPPRCVPACEYIDLLLDLIDGLIDNEKVFPSADSSPTVAQFPLYFDALMQLLFKRLFRAYAHIYHHHFHQFVALGAEPHLNTCFKRFVFFVMQFRLVEQQEVRPMAPLVKLFMQDEEARTMNAQAEQMQPSQQAQ